MSSILAKERRTVLRQLLDPISWMMAMVIKSMEAVPQRLCHTLSLMGKYLHPAISHIPPLPM
jgi:hypothetical protein